jgi:hypothetical protein
MSEVVELLERFRRGGEFLASLTTGAAGAELDYQPEPGAMGIRSIACHLMDTEMMGHGRFSMLIAEDAPVIQPFNGTAWAEKLNYRQRKFSGAVEMFRRVRAENYDLLKDLPEEAWARQGTHAETGPITLLELFRDHVQHTEEHVMEIREIRQKYKAARQAGTLS